jgi:hypothetical protein
MAKIKDRLELVNDIKTTIAVDLISIISYKGVSLSQQSGKLLHEMLMIVVEEIDYDLLKKIQKKRKEWSQLLPSAPLIITKEEIISSLDIFPSEFLQISENYNLLAGEDVFAGIEIPKENLRLQIELNMKAKIIQLRESVARGDLSTKELLLLSLADFTEIFQNVLRLLGKEFEVEDPNGTIILLSEELVFSPELLFKLIRIIKHGEKTSSSELDELFGKYLEQLQEIARKIDQLKV